MVPATAKRTISPGISFDNSELDKSTKLVLYVLTSKHAAPMGGGVGVMVGVGEGVGLGLEEGVGPSVGVGEGVGVKVGDGVGVVWNDPLSSQSFVPITSQLKFPEFGTPTVQISAASPATNAGTSQVATCCPLINTLAFCRGSFLVEPLSALTFPFWLTLKT